MILDLVATDSMCSFNIVLAQKIGLQASVYINELLNINKKAVEKQKISNEGYFKVNRGYVTSRTTLTKEEQEELDKTLSRLSIINILPDTKDTLKLDVDALTGVMLDNRKKIVDEVKTLVKPKKETKEEKQENIKQALKSHVNNGNDELDKAYFKWIDSIYSKNGWMSTAAIEDAQIRINNYTHRNLDEALEILRIAAINGWRDIQWAINSYDSEKNRMTFLKNKSNNNIVSDAIIDNSSKDIKFSDKVY